MSRVNPDQYTFPWGDADKCPCDSGMYFARCCKRGSRQLPYISLPSLLPPGEATNFENPNCYMSETRNCSKGKSREHYISEAILKRFDQLRVSGMPWQEKGATQLLPPKALAANILCDRHNSALAPLDDMGLRAFNAIVQAADYAVNAKYPGKVEHYLVSGDGLEIWMIKVLSGIYYGGIATSDGICLRDTHAFDSARAVEALTLGQIPEGATFYVSDNLGLNDRGKIEVGPFIDTASNSVLGLQMQLTPVRFETSISKPPLTVKHFNDLSSRRRPRVIDFIGPVRDSRVIFTWRGHENVVKRLKIEIRP